MNEHLLFLLQRAPLDALFAAELVNGPIGLSTYTFTSDLATLQVMLNRTIKYPPTKVGEVTRIALNPMHGWSHPMIEITAIR